MKNQSTVLSEKIAFLKKCKEAFLSFVFPSHCIHCKQEVEGNLLLCPCCLDQIEPFQEAVAGTQASCMQSMGPARSLAFSIKGPAQQEIVKAICSFMVLRMQTLDWQTPDYIFGAGPNAVLAQALGLFFNRPAINVSSLSFLLYKLVGKKNRKFFSKNILVVSLTAEEIRLPEEMVFSRVCFLSFLG